MHASITEGHLFVFSLQMCLVAPPCIITMRATPTHSTTVKVRFVHLEHAALVHSHTHSTSGLASTVRSLANQARGSVFLLAWTFVSPLPKEFQGKYYYWKRRIFFLE